jgi:hypothetical protein
MKYRKGPKSQGQTSSKPAVKMAAPPPKGFNRTAVALRAADVPKAISAFDVWLERGLHTLFDEVANEPIPAELLQLIEDDRRKVEDDKTN